jgi:hypothetical protein
MTPEDRYIAIRNEMDGVALTVHKIARGASSDSADALVALADMDETIAAARRAILDLPVPTH